MVIPAFNPSVTLATAIDSVRAVLPHADIVVVDDGSSNPVEIVGVNVVRQLNRGPASARNAGAANTQAEWLLFLDDDDVLLVGALDAVGALDFRVGLVCGAGELVHRGATTLIPIRMDRSISVRVSSLAGTFIVHRDVFNACGGYDEMLRFGENTDLIIRAAGWAQAAGLEVLAVDSPMFRYHAPLHSVSYDAVRLAAIEHLLAQDRAYLRSAPDRALYHGIAAVSASRLGLYRTAVSHALTAARLKPSVRTVGRLGAAMTRGAGRWWWTRAATRD